MFVLNVVSLNIVTYNEFFLPPPEIRYNETPLYILNRIVQKAIIKKGFSKNTWNKVKLQNRYRARWAKGKTGIGLDEHRATHA